MREIQTEKERVRRDETNPQEKHKHKHSKKHTGRHTQRERIRLQWKRGSSLSKTGKEMQEQKEQKKR